MEKVWIVTTESCIDGEIYFDVNVCATKKRALMALQELITDISKNSYHFKDFGENEDFEIEQSDEYFFINDPSDDYYFEIKIDEKEIVD